MVPVELNWLERWQVVGYVRALQLQREASKVDEGARLDIKVGSDRILAGRSRTDQWVTYSGSLDGHRFTSLAEIKPANVSRLRLRWIAQFDTEASKIEATPLVVDGVIFVTQPPSNVVALDAKSGRVLWSYRRTVARTLPVCCGIVNRGLAIFGHTLFLATADGKLIAIDANTGQEVWQTDVADPDKGYTLSGAPLVADQLVVVGVAGAEFGIRGYLAAYSVVTGKQVWKFFTIPEPGEAGHESWKSDAWRTGGGATWNTGSYDPSLGLLYWGVGNPSPDFSGDTRPGDNLFTNSVVALHAASGRLAWHFQFTPHDEHDWDAAQTPILADLVIQGARRKVLCWPNRNGFYYVLDRVTGRFVKGTPFVEQNWAKGLDSEGRPIPMDEVATSLQGRLTRPGSAGATNWQNAALDERRGLVFVHATEGASVYTKSPVPRRAETGEYLGSGASLLEPVSTVVRALDATTGTTRWEHFTPASKEYLLAYSGLLATGSGLVFGASGGHVFALDSSRGRELWRVSLGGPTFAAPISFTVDGQQVVAVAAGRSLFVFGL
jgi:alcohol dehydrogenase (cytochrome c)